MEEVTRCIQNDLESDSKLTPEQLVKLEVMMSLIEHCDRDEYGQRLRSAADRLGISVRSVQRLFKNYCLNGLSAITTFNRRDKGTYRIDSFWQDFIVKTYKTGNEGSRRMTPKQVALRAEAKSKELGEENYPSYRTVLRVLEPIVAEKKQKKSIRSPGWKGTNLSVKTRDGQDLEIKNSNQVWQCDHTPADVLLVDRHGKLLGRPWLTTVIDSYSRCIMGINLGFDAPSSQVVGLALRHAILPKNYGLEYKLHCEWLTWGKPNYLFTDGGKDFRSNHLAEIATELGIILKLRNRPSEGGIVERPFRTFNQSLFSTLPGYTGSNVKERPKDTEKDAQLTLRELEHLLVRFIVDNYNQSIDARMGDQTRYQRWDSGLNREPDIISERDLDVCLMKQARRTIQRGGHLQFENITYKGEYLAAYAGQTMSFRYDPSNITTILVYRQENGKEIFLTRAHAQGIETEQISLSEAKESTRRIREQGKVLTNDSIAQEVIEREASVGKQTRKQRQKAEQAHKQSKLTEITPITELVNNDEIFEIAEDIEVLDYDSIRGDYEY
jgi:putative transposase